MTPTSAAAAQRHAAARCVGDAHAAANASAGATAPVSFDASATSTHKRLHEDLLWLRGEAIALDALTLRRHSTGRGQAVRSFSRLSLRGSLSEISANQRKGTPRKVCVTAMAFSAFVAYY